MDRRLIYGTGASFICRTTTTVLAMLCCVAAGAPSEAEKLAKELEGQPRLCYAARAPGGDWDLFTARADGSDVRNLTSTPQWNEALPRFSPDGRMLLYRRLPRDESFDGNRHGTQGEPMLSDPDGTNGKSLGKSGEFPWASFSPDSKRLATLEPGGIKLIDLSSLKIERKIARQGFFQQMTWSPDGNSMIGVSNAFGTAWAVARLDLASGKANAVSAVDCCTPDWFPDGHHVIFSNRPKQWTQLWTATPDGKTRQLVYAEDGRHVYGGCVSPDGKYVVFTGNHQEDGDAGNAGSPMAIMRLADAPIIGGDSDNLRKEYPKANRGPVHPLPAGWEPCWVPPATEPTGKSSRRDEPTVRPQPDALHKAGWITYSARSKTGDWDLYRSRPDGSDVAPLTHTAAFNEAGPRFSHDGKRLLYYRMPVSEPLDNNTYGTFDLMLADADGSHVRTLGREYAWACWGPDDRQIACLHEGKIAILDVAKGVIVRELPRGGIVQQLGWSDDGKWFTGTANGLGQYWNVARVSASDGKAVAVSETDRYNCTPDWVTGSNSILYARGIIPEKGGFAQLWIADADQLQRHVLYAEEGRHIYGACASPDGKYAIFTRSTGDLGKVADAKISMSIIAMDANARGMPERVDLGEGWEPTWTRSDPVRTAEEGR